MVTKYGMSDLVGNVSIDYEDQGRSLSPETRAAVETEVRGQCIFWSFPLCRGQLACIWCASYELMT